MWPPVMAISEEYDGKKHESVEQLWVNGEGQEKSEQFKGNLDKVEENGDR